jgi:HAMP domain-containing protein
MLSALLSFLGGSAFRMIWGEVSAFLSRRQEHAQEIERMRLQEEMAAAQHARNLDAIRLQADLGVKVIEVARDAELAMVEASAWERAVDQVGRLTGIKVIDLWNQSIRPLLATLAILVVVGEVIAAGFVLTEWTRDLVAAILGLYVADRSLSKRGK